MERDQGTLGVWLLALTMSFFRSFQLTLCYDDGFFLRNYGFYDKSRVVLWDLYNTISGFIVSPSVGELCGNSCFPSIISHTMSW